MSAIIVAIIIPIMSTIRTVARTFNIPTLDISPIASPIAKASPKLSYFAYLHIAINWANANTTTIMNMIMVVNIPLPNKKRNNADKIVGIR